MLISWLSIQIGFNNAIIINNLYIKIVSVFPSQVPCKLDGIMILINPLRELLNLFFPCLPNLKMSSVYLIQGGA